MIYGVQGLGFGKHKLCKIEQSCFMFNDWVASMKHERYLSLSLLPDSTPISNLVTLTFTITLSDQIETSSHH